jgi:hypothetical protein
MVGVGVDHRYYLGQAFLSGDGETTVIAFFVEHFTELLFEDVHVLGDIALEHFQQVFIAV